MDANSSWLLALPSFFFSICFHILSHKLKNRVKGKAKSIIRLYRNGNKRNEKKSVELLFGAQNKSVRLFAHLVCCVRAIYVCSQWINAFCFGISIQNRFRVEPQNDAIAVYSRHMQHTSFVRLLIQRGESHFYVFCIQSDLCFSINLDSMWSVCWLCLVPSSSGPYVVRFGWQIAHQFQMRISIQKWRFRT